MHFKKLLSVFLIGASFLAIVIAGVFWNNLNEAKGAPSSAPSGSVAVTGYAWSSNIGWIKFNPSYGGVFYNTSTGNLSGYAWSSNIGWIKFDGLLADSGVGGAGATANPKTGIGYFSGWARACAGTQSGDCSSMTSRIDGWDGWIRLDHVSVDFSTGKFAGYAWGSEVVGWISFSGSNYQVIVSLGRPDEPTVDKTLTVEIYGEKWTDGSNIAGGSVTGTNSFSCVGNKTTDASTPVGEDKLLQTCTKDYTKNTNVDLYASPASGCPGSGCGFKKWDGACSGGNCSFTIDTNKTVKTYFKVTQGGGDPDPDPDPVVTDGACGTATNYKWDDDGPPTSSLCSSSGGNTTPVKSGSEWTWTCNGSNGGAPASCSAGYNYNPTVVNLTLDKTGSGTGNVKLYGWRATPLYSYDWNDYGQTTDNDFTDGETKGLAKDWWFKMVATPDSGSYFSSWSNCSSTDPKGVEPYSEGTCFVTMDANKTVTVTFNDSTSGCAGCGSSVKAYISARDTVVTDGNSTVVTWTSDNADSCEQKEGGSGSDTGWISASDTTSGSYTTANFTTSDVSRTYTIECAKGSQKSGDVSVTVDVGSGYTGSPSITMWADPQSVGYKKTSKIKWLASNIFGNCLLFSASDTMNDYLKDYGRIVVPSFRNGYYAGVGNNNTTGQTTGKLTADTTYKIQCEGYGPRFTKVPAQTTVAVAKPVSNFTLTNPTGASLVATIVEGLSANSSSTDLSLSGEAIGNVTLSASIPGISGAEAKFSSDNGLNYINTLSVDISAISEVKIKAFKIPGATPAGIYNVAITATDTGTGGKTKELDVDLRVDRVSSEWKEI